MRSSSSSVAWLSIPTISSADSITAFSCLNLDWSERRAKTSSNWRSTHTEWETHGCFTTLPHVLSSWATLKSHSTSRRQKDYKQKKSRNWPEFKCRRDCRRRVTTTWITNLMTGSQLLITLSKMHMGTLRQSMTKGQKNTSWRLKCVAKPMK